jgi:hypothetical protein
VDILVILMHWTLLPPRISEPQDIVGKVGDCQYRFPILVARSKAKLKFVLQLSITSVWCSNVVNDFVTVKNCNQFTSSYLFFSFSCFYDSP